MRESQNKYEELISFCSDYSKEIENQNVFQPEAEENNADMFQQNQQRHQFGAISFYTTPQQQQQYGTILPVVNFIIYKKKICDFIFRNKSRFIMLQKNLSFLQFLFISSSINFLFLKSDNSLVNCEIAPFIICYF